MLDQNDASEPGEPIDIVELVSRYTDLKPKGRDLWGRCPFHQEKPPPFKVDPDIGEFDEEAVAARYRELCENFLHAYFKGVVVTISKDGRRICFSDEGPGVDLSSRFRKSDYSTAIEEMKPYIRGLGEGYSTIAASLAEAPEHISLIFGDKHGKGLSVSGCSRRRERAGNSGD